MAGTFLWKPVSDSDRKLVVLAPSNLSGKINTVQLLGQGGNVIESGRYTSMANPDAGGPRSHFRFNQPGGAYGQNVTVRFTLDSGENVDYNIANTNARYEGGDPSSLQESSGANAGQFTPGQAPGGYGFYPSYLGGMYPSPFLANFNPINPAPYNFQDPTEFLQTYGAAFRDQYRQDFGLASDLAQQTLDQELAGLRSFAPQAAALQRDIISEDNRFNQAERTRQVDETLPGMREDLRAQTDRANVYARGGIPDEIQDRAFELGIRSEAADLASAGGFGSRSSVSRKASDLMSARERLGLAQYGEGLLSQNSQLRSSLFLAPTSYSNAGQQIRVTPEVGAGRLTSGFLSEVTAQGNIPATTALSSNINQEQFRTNLLQNTNQYNASNQFAASQFNAGIQNQFAQGLFGYNVSYAGAVAGAYQTDANTQFAIQQQQQYADIYQDYLSQRQQADQAGAIASGVGALPGIISAGAQLISGVGEVFGLSGSAPSAGGQTSLPDIGQASGAQIQSQPSVMNIPADSPVPSGYTGISSNADGTVTVVPNQDYASGASAFSRDLGISTSPAQAATLMSGAAPVIQSAGMSFTPRPGYQLSGYDPAGQPVYMSSELANADDPGLGTYQASTLGAVLDPLGIFSAADGETFNAMAQAAGDINLLNDLSTLQANGDTSGFVNTVMGRFGYGALSQVQDSQDRAGLEGAYSAYQLYNNWDRMSSAQKSLALSSLGIKGYKYSTGEDLSSKIIPGTEGETFKGLNVGNALSLMAAGYNVYSMVNNWDQLNAVQKLTYGSGSVSQLANLGKSLNLLGSGTTGAAVPGVTAEALTAAGWEAAPNFGIGAITSAQSGASLPAGYIEVATAADGSVVAAPAGNADSAFGATAGSALQTVAGVAGVYLGAKAVYENWGTGGKDGAINGALGGSSMAAGMYALGATNPFLLAGVVALSVLGGAIKTGKNEDQLARDGIRKEWKSAGFVDDQWNVRLADGSTYNIGVDGRGGMRSMRFPDKAGGGQELRAYDVDYTNDLDFASAMGGTALSRLLYGEKSDTIDQMGGYLGNAALGNVGFGKDMTPENFSKAMTNMRGFYAQRGIKSKADAYQLANQAFAEGRINESDVVSMHQSFNMMYDDNGYETAQKLMEGRFRGIEVAKEVGELPAPKDKKDTPAKRTLSSSPIPVRDGFTVRNTYLDLTKNPDVTNNITAPGGKSWDDIVKGNTISSMPLDRDTARIMNEARYGRAA